MSLRNYALSGLAAAAMAVGSVGDARASNVGGPVVPSVDSEYFGYSDRSIMESFLMIALEQNKIIEEQQKLLRLQKYGLQIALYGSVAGAAVSYLTGLRRGRRESLEEAPVSD